jgi:catechol 2,3-dioxygenase-like lactoylglutathione lyase family enzyme
VEDQDFEPILERVRARGLPYWADPFKQRPGEINRHFGGRGVYFEDPDGHLLEVITRPYGAPA